MERREMLNWLVTASVGAAVPMIVGVGCEKPVVPATPPPVTDVTPASAVVKPQRQLRQFLRNVTVRKSADRGSFDFGWLKTQHSFSFARYYDPRHMGFRALRVINEDVIKGGRGFPMHPHRDMEIVTYILDGALRHRDSLGNGSIIRPGEIQRMSAGTGIRHSEFNPSSLKPVHLLQIWLLPGKKGSKPGYAQQVIPRTNNNDPVRLIASPNGDQGSVTIGQDVRIFACQLASRQQLLFEVKKKRHLWMQVARGELSLNGRVLKAGDGLSSSDTGWLEAYALKNAEVLIFDLA